jgi:hypothetical protein
MSQHDLNIANQGFPATRADLNNALAALASNSSGTSEPSTTYANQLWYDTSNDLLKFRNEADSAWITLAYMNQTTSEWEIRSGVVQAVDSGGILFKTDEGTTRVTLDDSGNLLPLDASVSLGGASNRFSDLYLSGGVYLGGTGSANKLDDYETGTFTPTTVLLVAGFSGSVTVDIADYQKVGDLVSIQIRLLLSSSSGNVAAGDKIILSSALPFTAASSIEIAARIAYSDDAGGITETNLGQGGSNIRTTVHSVRGTCPRATSVLAIEATYQAA